MPVIGHLPLNKDSSTVSELRRRPEGAMAPLREKRTINKASKLLNKMPKSMKQPENDLEQLYQKMQKLFGPLRKTA